MKGNFKKGFTLIELIVVIAIIGVLASILVPSVMGYVRKANRSTDLSTAKTISNDTAIVISGDGEGAESYSGKCSISRNVTVIHAGKSESYTIDVVSRRDANTDSDWKSFDADTAKFVKELNKMESADVALKFRTLSNHDELESWFVCRRAGNPLSVEVWAGDSGNNPLYGVWPETEDRYK